MYRIANVPCIAYQVCCKLHRLRAALASLFSAGCLIGALEGAPKTAGALKALTGLA